jgi:hypothetical protein
MAFFVIGVSAGLAPGDHRRAVRAGPPAVSDIEQIAERTRQAGFAEVTETDVTEEYLATSNSWARALEALRDRSDGDVAATVAQKVVDEHRMAAAGATGPCTTA